MVLACAVVAVVAVGCGQGGGEAGGEDGEVTLRLGYFANVTHAPALIGIQEGTFEDALGPGVNLDLRIFTSGPEVMEAIFVGGLDASFIGPNPAINGFAQSEGAALRIVAGATSGGASLVVRPGIDGPEDLRGTTLASPSLGNTQDVALRSWLADQGLSTEAAGGGDVRVRPQANADTLRAFQEGIIDGAWVPEPWGTRMVLEGDGERLLDERELWPDGQFVSTHLIVATEYLERNPQVIRALLGGLVDVVQRAAADPASARVAANDGFEAATGARLPDITIDTAWEYLSFTFDPIAPSLERTKDEAVEVGLLEPVDLEGIYDLTLLNEVLAERGLPAVADR